MITNLSHFFRRHSSFMSLPKYLLFLCALLFIFGASRKNSYAMEPDTFARQSAHLSSQSYSLLTQASALLHPVVHKNICLIGMAGLFSASIAAGACGCGIAYGMGVAFVLFLPLYMYSGIFQSTPSVANTGEIGANKLQRYFLQIAAVNYDSVEGSEICPDSYYLLGTLKLINYPYPASMEPVTQEDYSERQGRTDDLSAFTKALWALCLNSQEQVSCVRRWSYKLANIPKQHWMYFVSELDRFTYNSTRSSDSSLPEDMLFVVIDNKVCKKKPTEEE